MWHRRDRVAVSPNTQRAIRFASSSAKPGESEHHHGLGATGPRCTCTRVVLEPVAVVVAVGAAEVDSALPSLNGRRPRLIGLPSAVFLKKKSGPHGVTAGPRGA